MPRVYGSGQSIPGAIEGANTLITGATTLALSEPSELALVQAMCVSAERSKRGLGLLQTLFESIDTEKWGSAPELTPNLDWKQATKPDVISAPRFLALTLSLVHELWSGQQPSSDLTALVCVADSEQTVTIVSEAPALVFHPGSLIATVLAGASAAPKVITAVGWVVCLMPNRGFGASARLDRMIRDVRAKALQQPGVLQLKNLEELSADDLAGKTAAVIVVHGLMSIDIGLCDNLINAIKNLKGLDEYERKFADQIEFVGWPHNTLHGISTNAQELSRLIVNRAKSQRLFFICHSRGGIVVRRLLADWAKNKVGSKWIGKVAGVLTFGTPHEGCPLAEVPEPLAGLLIAIQAYRKLPGVLSVADALWYFHLHPGLDGVADLRPITSAKDFLYNLVQDESEHFGLGEPPPFPTLAIGGNSAYPPGLLGLLVNRALGGIESDLLVPITSSIPYGYDCLKTDCDHFSYFAESEAQKQEHLNRIVRFAINSIFKNPEVG